jgi:hypothetical protein
MDCGPSTYLHTKESFVTACRTAMHRTSDGRVVNTQYPLDLPTRAIHLFRSPFDNLMGRLHLSKKRKQSQPQSTNSKLQKDDTVKVDMELWKTFDDSTQGVVKWCHHLHEHWKDEERAVTGQLQTIRQLYGHVPCFAEWYRYIQWHNLAYQTAHTVARIPVDYLYYENYTLHYNDTVQELRQSLQLPAVQTPLPFASHAYRNIFPPSWVSQVAQLMHDVADPPVWDKIRHYFEDPLYIPQYTAANSRNSSSVNADIRSMDESRSVAMIKSSTKPLNSAVLPSTNIKSPIMSPPPSKRIDSPLIAWLLSFPNSVRCKCSLYRKTMFSTNLCSLTCFFISFIRMQYSNTHFPGNLLYNDQH